MHSLRPLTIGLTILLFIVGCAPTVPSTTTGGSVPSNSASGPRTESRGELRMADNSFPASLDANVGAAGYSATLFGYGETLMKVSPKMQIEPWIAEKLELVEPTTWRVTVRNDATFHDGSKIDAAAVKTSLELSMQKQPGTVSLIPAGTQFTANGQVLEIKTPTVVALMPNSLAAFNFIIAKPKADGALIFTGPFIVSDFVPQTSLVLNAYPGYRGGPARIKTIRVRNVPDVNARALALQAGDVDMASALLPSQIDQLRASGLEVTRFSFSRTNEMILNVTRAPLDDVRVRQAIAAAIDRDALIKGVMNGIGRPAYAFAPDSIGLEGLVNTQKFDQAESKRLLDAADWQVGPDGIRSKNGNRLAFKLGSYQSRAELEPLAIAIKDQLRAVGIDVSLENFPDINSTVANSTFDATMYSYSPVPFGDLNRGISQFFVPSGTNNDRYNNPKVTELYAQYLQATDVSKRRELLGEMQRAFGADVPVVYVINPDQINASSKKVKNYVPHPLENYKITADLAID